MMMKKPEESLSSYSIDLISIEGDGSFLCPKCGMTISPEDETEENYKVIDTTVVNNELTELVIECSKCRTTIRLTGFQQQ